MTAAFFYGFAALAVISALAMVLNLRNTVAAAMSLVVTMLALAGIYVLLEAHLVAVIQILVYAGAVVVLFLFVVMLLNLRHDAFVPARQRVSKLLGALLVVAAVWGLCRRLPGYLPEVAELPPDFGGLRAVGLALFGDFVLPFEVTSLLLLAAIVAAVVLAKRKLD